MTRVLFLVPYPIEGASNRYRISQFLDGLTEQGVGFRIRSFAFKRFYAILYRNRNKCMKVLYFLLCAFNRLVDLWRARTFDVIFIHRECFPVGPAWFEMLLRLYRKPILYDFDDAIFLTEPSSHRSIDIFKHPRKVRSIIRLADSVLAGNEYLARYARRFNRNVSVLPTVIDTKKFTPKAGTKPLVIGWVGSHSTQKYLRMIIPVLQQLAKRHDFVFKVVGSGDTLFIDGVSVLNKKWRLKTEVEEFEDIDIGVYPMPDDKWTRGKCGFKAIQYMAMGIPTVASPVGVNKSIINHGKTGYFASTHDAWCAHLEALILDPALRRRIGKAGRRKIVKEYSVQAVFPRFYGAIRACRQRRYR